MEASVSLTAAGGGTSHTVRVDFCPCKLNTAQSLSNM